MPFTNRSPVSAEEPLRKGRPVLPVRLLRLAFALAWLGAAPALARTGASDWVTSVVTKISTADRTGAGGRGTVTIRVRIAADGSLDGVSIEAGSGSQTADERALRAVRAAAPFKPPPTKLLSLEGYTELAFPLDVGDKTAR